MFSSGFRSQKLKTSLRISINRLKLMEKKKTEIALKARKEIADFIQANKYDRARIRVENIIREDYLVEAMELVEMYCDLLIARFGLIDTMKYCEEGLVESVSTIIWSAPRLSTDCVELKTVSDQLSLKYGKEFAQQARSNTNNTVNERLIHKLSPDPPPKILVERYLIEIARNYNVPFEPDPDIMMSEGIPDINSKEFEAIGAPGTLGFNHYDPPSGPGDFGPPPPPSNFPPPGGPSYPGGGGGGGSSVGGSIPYPPNPASSYPPDVPPYSERNPYPPPSQPNNAPAYTPPYNDPSKSNLSAPPNAPPAGVASIPTLPDVPGDSLPASNTSQGDDVDFDDLTRRFEELKKKK